MKELLLFLVASFSTFLVEAHIGKIYSLESINYPAYRIGVGADGIASILLNSVEEFRIVKGLNGQANTVSFQSVKNINQYLRHQNFILKLHTIDSYSDLFKNDASFIIREDKYYPGYVSLESVNYPGFFLRHQDYTLKLHKEDPYTELYKKDASFKLVQLIHLGRPYSLVSLNYPLYRVGVLNSVLGLGLVNVAGIVLGGADKFRIVKGLNGQANTVSFQSVKDSNQYLRHQDFILKQHPVDTYSELFKNDASFILRQNKYFPDYFSLESINYPGYFIRHQNFILKLHKEEPYDDLYKKDASFELLPQFI